MLSLQSIPVQAEVIMWGVWGSKIKSEGIFANKNLVAEICIEVAYFLDSYVKESEGYTFSIKETKNGGGR